MAFAAPCVTALVRLVRGLSTKTRTDRESPGSSRAGMAAIYPNLGETALYGRSLGHLGCLVGRLPLSGNAPSEQPTARSPPQSECRASWMDWASSWLMPGTLASLVHPGFFTSCRPPRYLSSACLRLGPTREQVFQGTGGARLCPSGRWPVMAKRWDSSRMCWMRCRAGMSAGRCSSS